MAVDAGTSSGRFGFRPSPCCQWRYLTSYSEASIADAADNSNAENPELAQELMASYADLSIVSTVDAFGTTSDTQIVGIDRLPAAYQLDVSDFAEQVSDLSTPVAAGELGIGAVWTDQRISDVFGRPAEVIYEYEVVAIEGTVYTLDFSFSATPVGSVENTDAITASGSIIADANEPIPIRAAFTITALLPIGYEDPPDPVATIEVLLEGS